MIAQQIIPQARKPLGLIVREISHARTCNFSGNNFETSYKHRREDMDVSEGGEAINLKSKVVVVVAEVVIHAREQSGESYTLTCRTLPPSLWPL